MRLLVVGDPTSFVLRDVRALGTHVDVDHFHYRGRRDLLELMRRVRRADVVLSWFCDHHALMATFLARRFGRRSVVMDLPSQGFLPSRPLLRMENRWTLRHADVLIAPSERVRTEMLRVAAVPRTVHTVPLAVDTNLYRPDGPKLQAVVTVALVVTDRAYERKNIPLVVECARRMPTIPFRLIGIRTPWANRLEAEAPPNLQWSPPQPPDSEELIRAYQMSWAYLQPSYLEGFGVAVAEAMASGCIPVVSDIEALRDLVGEAGYIRPPDPGAMVDGLRHALEDRVRGEMARAIIKERFSLERRTRTLLEIISAETPSETISRPV